MRHCVGLGIALLLSTGAVAQDTWFVLIDRSEVSYWVLGRLPNDMQESLKPKLQPSAQVEMVDWSAFKADPQRYVAALIVKDEYPNSNLMRGVVALLEKYPRTQFGITWTGGIAITRNDYVHTQRIYKLFREDKDEYERRKVSSDQARDPIHPENHLGPLLATQPAVDGSRLPLVLMEVETVKIRKQVCEARFPAYAQRNEVAYRDSPYASVTSEQLIEAYAEPAQRAGILRGLENDRNSTISNFQKMDAARFEKMCAELPQAIERFVKARTK